MYMHVHVCVYNVRTCTCTCTWVSLVVLLPQPLLVMSGGDLALFYWPCEAVVMKRLMNLDYGSPCVYV